MQTLFAGAELGHGALAEWLIAPHKEYEAFEILKNDCTMAKQGIFKNLKCRVLIPTAYTEYGVVIDMIHSCLECWFKYRIRCIYWSTY